MSLSTAGRQPNLTRVNMDGNRQVSILHVITTLQRGGAERQLVNLVSNTNRTQFRHKVAFLRKPDDLAEEIRSAGWECICLEASGRTQWIATAKKLRQLIKKEEPHVIQSWLFDANIGARLVAPLSRTIPIVVSLQNADYDPETLAAADLNRGKVGFLRLVDSLSARWVEPAFVACSDFVKKSASEQLRIPPSRVEVIYNSLDPRGLEASVSEVTKLRATLGTAGQGFVFLHVGRLDPQKGQVVLLKAFRKVANAVPDANLLIIGDGPLKKDLIDLTEQFGLSKRVLFLGKRSDVGAFLSLADVFVFPSFFEGLPLALIEAMSKGLPCITSAIETLREVAQDRVTALMITPGSVEELANAMIELHSDPAQRALLGNRAQQETNRKFQISTTIIQWERLYSRLAAMKSESGSK